MSLMYSSMIATRAGSCGGGRCILCIYRKRAVGGKNLAAQKIGVEYLKFHGGDLLPLLLYIRYTIRIYPDHHPTMTSTPRCLVTLTFRNVSTTATAGRVIPLWYLFHQLSTSGRVPGCVTWISSSAACYASASERKQ